MIGRFLIYLPLLIFLLTGCAHTHQQSGAMNPSGLPGAALPETIAPSEASPPTFAALPQNPGKTPTKASREETPPDNDFGDIEIVEEAKTPPQFTIADPLEPFNRAMFHFNDRLYFWLLKPVGQAYRQVVPKPARLSIRNFFSNLGFPVRFVNSVLQGDLTAAATETGRFLMNTLWGVGGLLDPASRPEIALPAQRRDFGQTLGVFGLGKGFFINWPVLGPSSPRDTIGMFADSFLSPLSYVSPWEVRPGARLLETVNHVSLTIGDYETLLRVSIDPYIALRDAYVQRRAQMVIRARKALENRQGGREQ